MRTSLNAPINGLPEDGVGEATHGKFGIASFQMSISPPFGLHFGSNSHPWGGTNGHSQHRLYCSTELLQRVIITWRQNNGTHKLCAFPQVWKTYSCWIFSVAGNLTQMLYSRKYLWIVSHSVYINAKCAVLEHDMPSSRRPEGLMAKGWCFVSVVQNFI